MDKEIDTYYIKVEIGRHVPDDNGFYAIFDIKEITSGMDRLKESIEICVNALKDYIKRITEEK